MCYVEFLLNMLAIYIILGGFLYNFLVTIFLCQDPFFSGKWKSGESVRFTEKKKRTGRREEIVAYSMPGAVLPHPDDPKAISCSQFFLLIMKQWQRDLFRRFPSLIILDSTHATNRNNSCIGRHCLRPALRGSSHLLLLSSGGAQGPVRHS